MTSDPARQCDCRGWTEGLKTGRCKCQTQQSDVQAVEPVAYHWRGREGVELTIKSDTPFAASLARHNWKMTPLVPADALATAHAEVARLKAANARLQKSEQDYADEVARLTKELKRFTDDGPFIVGWNDGYETAQDAALAQVAAAQIDMREQAAVFARDWLSGDGDDADASSLAMNIRQCLPINPDAAAALRGALEAERQACALGEASILKNGVVSPIRADGSTIEAMWKALLDTPAGRAMANAGDTRLFWMNEGDAYRLMMPSPSKDAIVKEGPRHESD